jgi:hypothetical protein
VASPGETWSPPRPSSRPSVAVVWRHPQVVRPRFAVGAPPGPAASPTAGWQRPGNATTDLTWAKIADELDLLTLGTFTGPAGTFRQTTGLTKTQRDLLAKLTIAHLKKIIEATRQPHDQQRHRRLVTRPVTTPARVRAAQTMYPGTMPDTHLRNPGHGLHCIVVHDRSLIRVVSEREAGLPFRSSEPRFPEYGISPAGSTACVRAARMPGRACGRSGPPPP